MTQQTELDKARGEGGQGIAIPLTRGEFALVDPCDYEWLSQWKWYCSPDRYATRTIRSKKRVQRVWMHRLILPPPKSLSVDHVNGDGLDNRRSNLRIVSNRQNQMNSSSRKNSSSIYKGVARHKSTKKWIAYIRANGKHKHLGLFVDEKDAANAYNQAAALHFGEFAKLNVIGGLL